VATIRPLPRSLDPLPDESLPGFLLRLAHRLDLAPARVVALTGLSTGPGLQTRAPLGLMVHLDPAVRDVFARATRLTPGEAAGLCLSALAERYPPAAPIRVQRAGAEVIRPDRWVFTTATRYCPHCLAGDDTAVIQRAHGGAWRRSWRLPPVFACMTHRRLLAHLCPACRQPAHARSRTPVRILPRARDSTLHPAQCRAAAAADAGPGRPPACGARLDTPSTSDPERPIPASLLDFQQRLLGLLDRDGPATTVSIGHDTTVERYFTDLRLLSSLICASWPQARSLAPSAALADAIDHHAARQRKQIEGLGGHAARSGVHPIHDTPPLDSMACAGLLATADRILSLDDPRAVGEQLRPLLAHGGRAARRTRWGQQFLRADPDCSAGLRQAVEPLLRTFTRTDSKPHGRRAPTRRTRFGPQHIPQFLHDDWYARHFRHLTGINPKLLRRTAAIRLVQMVAGGSMGEAADYLGIPPASIQHGRVYSGAGHVHAWARARPDPRAFDAALHALADELNAATNLIDYQRRRDALRTWCLDTDTWQQLTSRLPLTPGPIQPDLGDRKRQCASVVVWARITQGEHLFAPHPIEEEQPPAVRRAWRLRRDTTWFLFQTDRPKRHYADLRKLLDAYADQLAERIDAGWTAANQEQTSPPSSNPEPSRP